MLCRKCGAQLGAGAAFCGQCGVKVVGPGAAPTRGSTPAQGLAQNQPPVQPQQPVGSQPALGSKGYLLAAIEQELANYPQLIVTRGDKSDLEIKSIPADKMVMGKKVEYSACLVAKEDERKVVYWEILKEIGMRLGTFGGFKTYSFSAGKTTSGSVREVGFGPGGKTIDYKWDYGKTRSVVEGVVKANGWKFATSVRKGAAEY